MPEEFIYSQTFLTNTMLKLNLLQKKVLKLLTINCRYTHTEIASVTNTTPASVQYTVNQLLKKKKIGYPVTIFNGRPFGYKIYYIFVRLTNVESSLKTIQSISEIIAIIRTFGEWDAQIIVHAKDSADISKILEKICTENKNIADYFLYEHLADIKWNYQLSENDVEIKMPHARKNITKTVAKENIAVPYEFGNNTLDELDRKISVELLKNPMISYSKIASRLNSNHETIRYRVKKMIEKKWIQGFTVTPSFSAFGYFSYIVLIKTLNFDREKIKKYVLKTKDLWYATEVFGNHNLALYIGAKNPEEFTDKISELRSLLGKNLLDIKFVLFKEEEYNNQFPHQILSKN